MGFESEVSKYIKKKDSSGSKAKMKSNHRHDYVDCLFIDKGKPHKGSYCTICEEIGSWTYFETDLCINGFHRVLSDEEVFERYKGLEKIFVDNV